VALGRPGHHLVLRRGVRIAIGLALLAAAALVGLGWLAWRVWLALRDRRDPPERVERPPSISGAPRPKGLMIPRYPVRTPRQHGERPSY
jgi:hypothetical protein